MYLLHYTPTEPYLALLACLCKKSYLFLSVCTLQLVSTNTSTTNTIWPSSDILWPLCLFPLIITLVLFIFTFTDLLSIPSFHQLSFLISSSSLSAITAKSSAYSSHGKASVNSRCCLYHYHKQQQA